MEEGANLIYSGKQGGISSYLGERGILSTKNSQIFNFSLYKRKNLGEMPYFWTVGEEGGDGVHISLLEGNRVT